MSDLYKIMKDAFDRIKVSEQTIDMINTRYVPTKDGSDDDDNTENVPDFPYINDPKGYVTHVPLEKDDLTEQEKEAAPPTPEEAGAEAGAETTPDVQPEVPEPTGDEGGIGDTGMDAAGNMPGVEGGMGLTGIPQKEEEKLTSTQLGRVYELKKIYSRLSSVESFLSRTTDEEILEIRKLVSQSIDLFELVISNYEQYKENVDEIIVTYYEFLDRVYGSIKTYFSDQSKE